MSDQRIAHRAMNLTMASASRSRSSLLLVPGQLAIGDGVRAGGLSAEPLDLVLLISLEVALEPEPLGRILLVAFPGQDVRCHAVQEPPVVADHNSAAGEL